MNKYLLSYIKLKYPNSNDFKFYDNSIIFTNNGHKYVIKKNKNDYLSLYKYLDSRGFIYLPKLEYIDKNIYVYKYENDLFIPSEQKISDLVRLIALLHNKTVYYKDISKDEVKEIYEKLSYKISDTYMYYEDIISMIEGNIYMSPSYYMLARNISSFFNVLDFCKKTLDSWYELMKNKTKKREVLLHNNLDLSHVITNKESKLISFDKARRDIPIYDFIYLYKKCYDKYDFTSLYKEYLTKFQLLEEEKILMYIILFIPKKVSLNDSEIKNVIEVSKLCNYLYITNNLFMEDKSINPQKQNSDVNK